MSDCKAVQCSDQMSCECGNVWDMNDPAPPECQRKGRNGVSDHTPVPWEARKNMVPHIEDDSMVWDGDFIIWEDDNPIACVNCCDGIGEEQAEMNANLMAAAPEMLEALELADAMLCGANMDKSAIGRKINAALAKAKGKADGE